MKIIHKEAAANGMVRVWVEDPSLDNGEAIMFKLPNDEPQTIRNTLSKFVLNRNEERRIAKGNLNNEEKNKKIQELNEKILELENQKQRLLEK